MKKIIVILFIVMVISVYINNQGTILIPKDAIRFRIVANSNNVADQELKLRVKNDLEKELFALVSNAKNIAEAREIITDNLDMVDNILKKYNIEYDISFGSNFFPLKEYKGITYAEGNYESLVITIGAGLGENWWCVLFPPLCLLDENLNLEDAEYQFYVAKLINKFM